jgi:hypothetical protein
MIPDVVAANNCQPPFLCNTGTGPQKTIGPPPSPKPLPHVNIASCMTASLIGHTLTVSEVTLGIGAVNVGAWVRFFGPKLWRLHYRDQVGYTLGRRSS